VIITTTDPITGEHLHDLENKPYVIEGEGRLTIKIYFESEESRRRYIRSNPVTGKEVSRRRFVRKHPVAKKKTVDYHH
jgi:hypothetical protein